MQKMQAELESKNLTDDRNLFFYNNSESLCAVREFNPQWDDSQIRILIVEDNATNLKIIKRLLLKIPYTVTLAKDGQEAVTEVNKKMFFNPHKKPFDIIFTDHEMPRLKGDQAVRRINSFIHSKGLSRIPIISISDQTFGPEVLKDMDIDEQIGKLFTSTLLIKTVKKHLNSIPTPQKCRHSGDYSYFQNPSLLQNRRKFVGSLDMISETLVEKVTNTPSLPDLDTKPKILMLTKG